MTFTTVLAVWGAVLSTISLAWNIRRDLFDRGKLEVVCYLATIQSEGGRPDSTLYLVYRVTNVGRRAVVVTHLGGARTKKTHFMVMPKQPLPRTLEPGQYFLEYTDSRFLHDRPATLWAVDSLDRHWRLPRRALKRLLREVQDRPTT